MIFQIARVLYRIGKNPHKVAKIYGLPKLFIAISEVQLGTTSSKAMEYIRLMIEFTTDRPF
jgi:hypothetical protein